MYKLPFSTRVIPMCAALALLGTAGGCKHDADAHPADSELWRLSEHAQLQVGSQEGPGQELDGVFSGLIGREGSVVIGNSGTLELRFFDATGLLARVAGRRGSGPGEFLGINWMRRFRGDSILVFDLPAQRFSVWSESGTFGRTFLVQGAQAPVRPVAVLSDHNIVVSAENNYDPRRDQGLVRDHMNLSVITPTGGSVGEVGRFPAGEWLLYKDADSFRVSVFPFGRTGYADASGGNVVYASSDSTVLTVYDRTGTIVRRVRLPETVRREFTPEAIDSVLNQFPDEGMRQAIRRQLRSQPGPVRAPAVSDLRVERGGDMWVRTPDSSPGVSRWVVFSTNGEEKRSVLIPDSASPLDIQNSTVLLRESGPDGVERVTLREVVR